MAQYGLMPSDISAALAEQNIEAAPGQFGENGDQSFQYVMRYKGRLSDEQQTLFIRMSIIIFSRCVHFCIVSSVFSFSGSCTPIGAPSICTLIIRYRGSFHWLKRLYDAPLCELNS